eukprot:GILK01007644.1.p1 GENE.GILK01007644.1~~GILK01007644.1.p1  ORF type:complete len:546 (-),score=84.75 GILK01007644.1:111-1661(-)
MANEKKRNKKRSLKVDTQCLTAAPPSKLANSLSSVSTNVPDEYRDDLPMTPVKTKITSRIRTPKHKVMQTLRNMFIDMDDETLDVAMKAYDDEPETSLTEPSQGERLKLQDKLMCLLEMFPSLDIATVTRALADNEWDIDVTAEKFLSTHQPEAEVDERYTPSKSDSLPGVGSDLMEAIRRANIRTDIGNQAIALRALADLALHEELQTEIVRLGGTEPILRVLRSATRGLDSEVGSDLLELQRLAATALANLALHESNQSDLVTKGSLPILIEILNRCNDSVIQSNCCRAMANLAYRNEANEALIAKEGGIKSMVTLLKTQKDTEVLVETCAALANLARNANYQELMVQLDAMVPLLNQIRCDHDVEIVQQACRTVANLCMSRPSKSKLIQFGTLDVLVPLMSTDNSYTRRMAVMAVANLSTGSETHDDIAASGCLTPLFNTLRSTSEELDCQRQAARALANLTETASVRTQVVQAGGLGLFLSLAQHNSEEVQLLAAKTLANIASVKGVSQSWL